MYEIVAVGCSSLHIVLSCKLQYSYLHNEKQTFQIALSNHVRASVTKEQLWILSFISALKES